MPLTWRVVGVRKELAEEVFEAGIITTVKRHLDRHMDNKSSDGYGPNAGSIDEVSWTSGAEGHAACLLTE